MNYNTKHSKEILEYFRNNKNTHLTADDVFSGLRNAGSTVGRTTVYRHIDKLYADGVIRRFSGGDGVAACYEYADSHKHCGSHYHLRCTDCGRLIHTDCDYMNELSEHILSDHGFKLDSEKTVIYGLCAECEEKRK